ncbi:MAG: NAD-glutamate dehydrogenase, partial [Asticcacaulis sp.]|nr:NAD-glutamate dehydrogenase [Asticcacaulis sp.]
MDDIILNSAGDSLHSLKDALTKGFAAAIGARDFLRLEDSEKTFLTQILEDFEADELPDLDAANLSRIIADFWAYGARRAHGTATLKRIEPVTTIAGDVTPYDLIEIVQTDSPFIVETVMGELIDQGISIRSMFHPVVTVARDHDGARGAGSPHKESMMLVFIERQNPDRRKAIMKGLDESLHDLKLAVMDFPRMQKLLAQEIKDLETLRDSDTVSVD